MKLKKVSPDQKGLAKLPTAVRNKMGYMEDGGKLDKGGHATKEYKKQKGKEAKHYRKGMIAKTKAGKSIHRTMRKRAARKAEAVKGKFKDSNEKSNYAYASFKEGGRVEKILKRGKKKAKRIHDREARKEAKGKDVKVLGTKRVNTGVGNPRFLNQPRGTVKVYAKERDAVNKADAKAAKVEGRQATKSSKRPKAKPPRIKARKGGPTRGRGRRADKPVGGGLKKFLQGRKNIRRNKKKGCFNRGDC